MSDAASSDEAALQALFRAIAAGRTAEVARAVSLTPALAHLSAETGATRENATSYFFESIAHYAYAGDTSLHIAAAAHSLDLVDALVAAGARVRVANRRGAEPLHYAADGVPGAVHWRPAAQVAVIRFLLEAGADGNAGDKDGATPLHRAVRTRCADAVGALLIGGADPRAPNKAGSTALHLAVQNTGRGGSGSSEAKVEQARIINVLVDHGARASDKDAKGKSVTDCVKAAWIQDLLERGQ